MRHHMDRWQSRVFVWALVFAGVVITGQGCSKKSESPPATSKPSQAATPAPAPTTGTVEGRVTGEKSQKLIAGRLLVLCQITTEPKCNLRTALKVTTGADGTFSIKDVAPGTYTAAHAKFSEKAEAKLKEGALIDPTARPVFVLGGTVIDIGMDGRLANVRGGVIAETSGLTFEFRKGKILNFEIRAGETTKAEVKAWGL